MSCINFVSSWTFNSSNVSVQANVVLFWSVEEPSAKTVAKIRPEACLPFTKPFISWGSSENENLHSHPTSQATSTQQLLSGESIFHKVSRAAPWAAEGLHQTIGSWPALFIPHSFTPLWLRHRAHRGIQLSQTKLQIRKPFKTSASPSSNLCGILSRLVPSLIMLKTLNNASLIRISQLGHARSPSVRPHVNE